MNIWLVYEQHIEKEGEELVGTVIAESEQNVREMLSKRTEKWFDPRYGKTDWMSKEVCRCESVGIANPDQESRIVWLQTINHYLVYGPRKQLLDRLYSEQMQRLRKKGVGE